MVALIRFERGLNVTHEGFVSYPRWAETCDYEVCADGKKEMVLHFLTMKEVKQEEVPHASPEGMSSDYDGRLFVLQVLDDRF